MFPFLSSLFSPPQESASTLDEALIQKATERVLEGTDKRLRSCSGYEKALRGPVVTAAEHIIALVDGLPAPIEINRAGCTSDPRLRAFFGSFVRFQEKIAAAKNVRVYIEQNALSPPDRVYGLLMMEKSEVRKPGTAMHGEIIRRDVLQTAVNFFNHDFRGLARSPEESSIVQKRGGFDHVIERGLEDIVATRSKRLDLTEKHKLLERKLAAMRAGKWGLGGALAKDTGAASETQNDPDALTAEIKAVEAEMSELGESQDVLGRNMEIVQHALTHAATILSVRPVTLVVDNMNIKVDAGTPGNVNTLELLELFSDNGQSRIILPCSFQVSDLPAKPDFFTEANRYL